MFRPGSVSGADLALRSFAGFFVETAPDVAGIADITRRHVEGRRLPGLLAPGLEEAVARGAVSAEEAATLTVDSLIVSGSGGRIYSPTNEGFITLQMKPATG